MALKKCPECGRAVSTRATACPSCGAPVKKAKVLPTGCSCLVILVGAVLLIVYLGHKAYEARQHPANEDIIAYEVLREEPRRMDGKTFLDVLVSDKATKEEVMRLGDKLTRDYAGRFACITIYDKYQVWRHMQPDMQRQDRERAVEIADEELDQHILFVASDIGQPGGSWVAKDRTERRKTTERNQP